MRNKTLPPEEIFDVVDEWGHVIGRAPRSRCHGNPKLIHQSIHIFVFSQKGQLFLQRRALTKDTQPGKWDTSVGGHLDAGEHPEHAARREMREELGAPPDRIDYAYYFIWRSTVETELVRTYFTRHDGPFDLPPAEIMEGRFWALSEIEAQLGSDLFTPQFKFEYPRMKEAWLLKSQSQKS